MESMTLLVGFKYILFMLMNFYLRFYGCVLYLHCPRFRNPGHCWHICSSQEPGLFLKCFWFSFDVLIGRSSHLERWSPMLQRRFCWILLGSMNCRLLAWPLTGVAAWKLPSGLINSFYCCKWPNGDHRKKAKLNIGVIPFNFQTFCLTWSKWVT